MPLKLTAMKQQNIDFLEEKRSIHSGLVQAGIFSQLDYPTKERFVEIMNEEFQPGYTANLWCGSCLSDMIKLVYRKYDEWKEAQPKEESKVEKVGKAHEPTVQKETFPSHKPVNEKPAKVAKKVKAKK